MATRAAIEEQIRLLNEQLAASTAYDPEFTPKELVRWNPELIGTVLHCEHTPEKCDLGTKFLPGHYVPVELFSILTDEGMMTSTEPANNGRPDLDTTFAKHDITNNFIPMTKFKYVLSPHGCATQQSSFIQHECKIKELNLDAMIEYEFLNGSIRGILNITMVPVGKSLLDFIYVSSIIRLPRENRHFVVHKYPLSRLYKQWKEEKDRRAPSVIPLLAAQPEDPRTKP